MDHVYRLPGIEEAAQKPLSDDSIGYWCQEGELKPVTISNAVLDHRKLWEVSFNDFLYSKYSTWDVVEDLSKSFLLCLINKIV